MQVAEPGTLPFNPETATDPTHEKVISFESIGQRYELKLQVPLYIWHALIAEDWDYVEKQVRDRADSMRLAAARAGNLLAWQDRLQEFAKTAAYNQFGKYQLATGNDSWAAPAGW